MNFLLFIRFFNLKSPAERHVRKPLFRCRSHEYGIRFGLMLRLPGQLNVRSNQIVIVKILLVQPSVNEQIIMNRRCLRNILAFRKKLTRHKVDAHKHLPCPVASDVRLCALRELLT